MADKDVSETPSTAVEDTDSPAKKAFLNTPAEFFWLWNSVWLITTADGNYRWSDGAMGGDNTIRRYDGTLEDLCKEFNHTHACPKGSALVSVMCGTNFQFVEDEDSQA